MSRTPYTLGGWRARIYTLGKQAEYTRKGTREAYYPPREAYYPPREAFSSLREAFSPPREALFPPRRHLFPTQEALCVRGEGVRVNVSNAFPGTES